MFGFRFRFLFVIVACALLHCPHNMSAQKLDSGISLQILAAPVSFPDSPGHAFMIVSVMTNNGPKEEALGFYPSPDNPLQAFVGGPGMMRSEFQKDPKRFSKVEVSYVKPITSAQRKQIYDLAELWDLGHYQLTDSNCIDFIDSVVRAMGWTAPTRVPAQTPVQYVRELVKMNSK